jgi:L-threonylcarbamoyladenylate synthase
MDMNEEIVKAVEVLRRGGLLLYPTDTVWGVGCDATNEQAVAKIYALKRSENKHGMIALLDSPDSVARCFARLPDVAWELIETANKPLTLILPGAVGVAPNLIPPERTLAVRIPDHEFCRALVRRLGRPLVSTSANISGEPAPVSFDLIDERIRSGVDMVVDRRFEGHPTGKPSSIIKLGPGGEVEVIRE